MSTSQVPRIRRASVAFILITLFIDSLGFGLVIPIVPKLVEQLLGGAISQASLRPPLPPLPAPATLLRPAGIPRWSQSRSAAT